MATSRNRRAAALQDWMVGEFCPEAVGRVRGYPKTPEAYLEMKARLAANTKRAAAKGTLTRRGVPNGWAGRKSELAVIRENARTDAERIIERLDGIDGNDMAKRALAEAYAIAVNPTVRPRDRIRAARVFLEFTVPKPTIKAALRQGTDPVAWLERLRITLN